MKIIKYQLATEINRGTPEEPDIEVSIAAVSMPYTEANYHLALQEAYQGEVAIEDDGQPEPEPEPHTLDERVSSLETTKADQTDVNELNEALNMLLTGYTGEEATDAEGTAR